MAWLTSVSDFSHANRFHQLPPITANYRQLPLDMFHLIAQISFGLAAGVIATLLKPYRNSRDFAVAIGIGLIGSLCGALIGRSALPSLSDLAGWVFAILGALLALFAYRCVFRSSAVY